MFADTLRFPWHIYIDRALLILAVLCVFAALAQPEYRYEIRTQQTYGIDVILALDVSYSMLAEDVEPSRIEAAKEVVQTFLEQSSGWHTGVVVFSGKPFVLSPKTIEANFVAEQISEVHVDIIDQDPRSGVPGTAIWDAILLSSSLLEDEEARDRVIILITDGESQQGVDPETAATWAYEQNITLYTVGIGTPEGTWVTVGGIQTPVKLDEPMLQRIAEIGAGVYYRAQTKDDLQQIFTDIQKLNTHTKTITESIATSYDIYVIWMMNICILGLLLLRLFLPIKHEYD